MNQPGHQKRPVANVDRADAAAYCKWVGKRLPTEPEWERLRVPVCEDSVVFAFADEGGLASIIYESS